MVFFVISIFEYDTIQMACYESNCHVVCLKCYSQNVKIYKCNMFKLFKLEVTLITNWSFAFALISSKN